MLDGAVAKRIGLSAAQLDKAKAIFKAGVEKEQKIRQGAYDRAIAPYKNVKPKTQAEAKDLTAKVTKAFDADISRHSAEIKATAEQTKKSLEAVVTKKQLDAYAALGGKKFEAK